MKKTLILVAFIVALPAGAVFADDCFVPMSQWQTREAVARFAAENGWSVRRIKIDDGCYEIKGTDVDGRRIEVKVNPATLQVIELEYADHSRRDRKRRNKD